MLQQLEVTNLIRELRPLRQLTQEEFAALLGVRFGMINRWHNDCIHPSKLALKQIRTAVDQLSRSFPEAL